MAIPILANSEVRTVSDIINFEGNIICPGCDEGMCLDCDQGACSNCDQGACAICDE